MNCKCKHFTNDVNIPIRIDHKKAYICADCGSVGPNLWMCLQRHCGKVGCSDNDHDHNTLHNLAFPSHAFHMNLSTRKIWCYDCKAEVKFKNIYDSDMDLENNSSRFDSGHGSYSTLNSCTPDRHNGFPFERTVGLNVRMGGDLSESSDGDDSVDFSSDKPMGLVGLQNIGNTCYMNAAIQALSNTEPLTKFFLDCPLIVQLLSEGRKPELSRTYRTLMRDIWVKKNGGFVSPSSILYGIRSVQPMFRGYHQHDTQEFLRNFMDQLHEELKQVAPSEPSSSANDSDTFSLAMEEPLLSSSYDSSEGEYETCDSGVSERSSLSDDTERPVNNTKRRLSRCNSPNRRLRQRVQSNSSVIDSQPSTSSIASIGITTKKQVKYRSIISDIFDGKLLSSVQCLTCNRVSSRVETFQDLSLPIPSRDHLVLLHGRPAGPVSTCSEAVLPVQDGWISWIFAWLSSWFYGPMVTLHDCLAAFFSTDELKGDNMYSCEKCNKLRNGVKFSKVLQLPEVLCIHLKRFRHELMFSSKISSAVSFPVKGLDMSPYLHKDCVSKVSVYELFSVICHHGTAGGGHYICYALNAGQWFEFDDQYVTKVTAEKVQSCEAYVLFYRKVPGYAEPIRTKAIKLASKEDEMVHTYISKQWLNRFHHCVEPGPIDNSDFLCHHGSINPDRQADLSQLAVTIPLEVYEYLQKKFGGCPPINRFLICPTCQALQNRILLEMETVLKISLDTENQRLPRTHYLSNAWYTQWHMFIQKQTLEPPGPIDNTKLNLTQLDLNEATDIPELLWNFFHNIYGGGPEIRLKTLMYVRSDSQESLQLPSEEDQEASDFVIPSLKKNSPNVIDKSLYSQGDACSQEGQERNQTTNIPEMSNNIDHPKKEVVENNHVGYMPDNTDDDIDEKEVVEVRSYKRHYRRRRKNVNST